MKKTIAVILLVFVLCIALAACNSTDTPPDQSSVTDETDNSQPNTSPTATEGLEYRLINNNKSYEVVGIGTATDTEIVIGDTYNGKPVTSIGFEAFSGCSGLTSITMPDSVTVISGSAFSGCSNLTSITIPNSVTSIGSEAFSGCTFLSEEGGVYYVDKWAVACDASAVSVSLRADTVAIGHSAFLGCNSLTSITIPDSVTIINIAAFSVCRSLTDITIPNSVTSLSANSFNGCDNLKSITISNSVTSIGEWTFFGCYTLQSITFNGTKSQWEAIEKEANWDDQTGNYTVHCTDGDIAKA